MGAWDFVRDRLGAAGGTTAVPSRPWPDLPPARRQRAATRSTSSSRRISSGGLSASRPRARRAGFAELAPPGSKRDLSPLSSAGASSASVGPTPSAVPARWAHTGRALGRWVTRMRQTKPSEWHTGRHGCVSLPVRPALQGGGWYRVVAAVSRQRHCAFGPEVL